MNTLPQALQELQSTGMVEEAEINELLRFYDEFERLREEDVQTQGYSYTGTKKGAERLASLLPIARLKATYIPTNTDEFLALPGQLGKSIFIRGIYDTPWQVCECIAAYPFDLPAVLDPSHPSITPTALALMLTELATLLYEQHRTHLSIDEIKQCHLPNLGMRSKAMLARQIAILINLGLLEAAPPGKQFFLRIRYEFAPLFAKLRVLQRQMRAEA